jgi:hypothetical protein
VEQAIILQTIDQLQELEDPSRKKHWLNVIQSELLYPFVNVYRQPLVFNDLVITPEALALLKMKDFNHFVDTKQQVELLLYL